MKKRKAAAKHEALLARLKTLGAERRAKRRRRAAVVGVIFAAMACLVLLRCSCDVPGVAVLPKPLPPTTEPAAPTPSAAPRKRAMRGHSLEGSLGPSRRPDLDIGGDAREPWFDRFRAQVSARSAAAARCFPDVARGAFRWDVDLRSNEGEASHSAYAPVAGLPELNDAQVACLEAALASAPFSLGAFKRESVRVSIVIEF